MIGVILPNNVHIKNVNVKRQGKNEIRNAILIIIAKINSKYDDIYVLFDVIVKINS